MVALLLLGILLVVGYIALEARKGRLDRERQAMEQKRARDRQASELIERAGRALAENPFQVEEPQK